ncbi:MULTISPECIES: hypothetical protein [Pseudolactococcus]|uniref:hypothetical protein n=1 Tax=Pseudolactococcus TaxID=3436058 RepID=UPI001436CA2B|nr:hypothetical protein [Lactococcus raffinolactis]QIW61862.1 hypothetical protein GU333_11855 [Lactococcus raffinolactis]
MEKNIEEFKPQPISVRNKLKFFYLSNKEAIFTSVLLAISGIAIYNSINLNNKISDKDDFILSKDGKITELEELGELKDARISELEELIELKDKEHLYTLSDSLRNGSSHAGSELNHYQKYINS